MADDKIIGRILHEASTETQFTNVRRVGKVLKFTAVLQDADTPNRNGRIYPMQVLKEALEAPFIKEKLRTNSLVGEMNHPEAGCSLSRQMNIDLRNVSHFLDNLRWRGKNLVADVTTADTAVGRDLMGMIESNGMVCSFSMRGGGDVYSKDGYTYVKSPLKIITWDLVHFPSHPVAYQQSKQLSESSNDILVTTAMVSEYIASQSENTKHLMENLSCFSDELSVDVKGDQVLITETTSGRPLGIALLEKDLQESYKNVLYEVLGGNY